MTDVYSIRHQDQRAITNADQVELRAIASGLAVADAGVIDNVLAGELDDLETADIEMEPWQRQDVQREDEVGSARDELERRVSLLGEYYPFKLEGGHLEYSPSKTGFYEYCLGIATTANSLARDPYTSLPRSFERVVGVILKTHMGPKWENMHTGWPRDDGEPTRFDNFLRSISRRTSDDREWVWNPEEGYPKEASWVGDGGLDFIVWRRSPDARLGQPFFVGQCACGNDWGEKFGDLDVEKLRPWMGPFTYVPIVRCFTTPFILSDGNFLVAHKLAGWVLDRVRLTIMIEEAREEPEIRAQMDTLKQMFDLAAAA